jgi:hypothetical protein
MEPITTTAMIGTVVGYLAKKLQDNKSVQDFFSEFTDATVKWLRPLFLTEDEKPKEAVQKLLEKPDSEPRQNAVKNTLEIALEEDPTIETHLKAIYNALQAKAGKGEQISIINSENVVTGNIRAQGHVIIGKNNTIKD